MLGSNVIARSETNSAEPGRTLCSDLAMHCSPVSHKMNTAVVPTKSDNDVIFCLQLLSKTLACIYHLSKHESIDHLSINPILWIGLIHK